MSKERIIGLFFLVYFGAKFGSENRNRTRAFDKMQQIMAKENELVSLGGQAAAAAHSLGTPLSTILLISKELKKEFYTIAFDVRGAGKSINLETDQEYYSFEQYSQDLNDILDFLSVEKVHVWSMAWGTRAAIAYSSMFPNKVISAVFSDASIGKADVEAQKLGLKEALEKQDEKSALKDNALKNKEIEEATKSNIGDLIKAEMQDSDKEDD